MPSKRKLALASARVAGYHEDARTFTRLIIESRVNRDLMRDAYANGMLARKKGVACSCIDCQRRTN